MKNNGGSVFPSKVLSHYKKRAGCAAKPVYVPTSGLSLRDYIATHNMSEMVRLMFEACIKGKDPLIEFRKNDWIESAAILSYRAADALIAERDKEK